MLGLYPRIKPYEQHRLEVDAIHTLYLEECGNPQGIPVVFLHGGPGAGIAQDHRRYFDPEIYRIILFDQRGAGQSTPHAELQRNTLADLITDLEKIRDFLDISKWLLFGGSWGSTLALAYAQAFPQHVSGLILRGVFLGSTEECHWIFNGGLSSFYPDAWDEFIDPIPVGERDDLINAYYQRLTGEDDITRMACAKAWSTFEARCAALNPCTQLIENASEPFLANSIARIECHYTYHHFFLELDQLINHMPTIEHLPGIIVHGRYDMICPLKNAWKLHQHWRNAELHIIRNAGHSASEPAIIDALVHATRDMANSLIQ